MLYFYLGRDDMKISDLNLLSILVIISSIILALYPLIYVGIGEMEISSVVKKFESVDFALKQFFYSEGFEAIPPSSISISTLVKRYYLKESPGKEYSLLWIDSDPSDGIVKAAIVYFGKVDPVMAAKKVRSIYWYDPKDGEIYTDYREGRNMAIIVEVKT